MESRYKTFIFLHFYLTFATAASQLPPAGSVRPITNSTVFSNLPVAIQCYPFDTYRTPLAWYCSGALQLISKDPTQQTFYAAQMPQVADFGKYRIQIEIVGAPQEQISWLEISLAAASLASGCGQIKTNDIAGQVNFLRTAGVLGGLGRSGSMVVRIGKPGRLYVDGKDMVVPDMDED